MGKLKLSPGTWVERELFQSPAFLSLSGFAPQLLIHILGKRQFSRIGRKGKEKRFCTNCDSLNITYTEYQKLGISQPRLTRALNQLLEKGFITVDGISLTVVKRNTTSFWVSIVDFTRQHTNLGNRQIGDRVNIEVDIIAKYVEQLSQPSGDGLTIGFLGEHGFIKN